MSSTWDSLQGPAKLLVICVAVFLVSGGLCGMEWFVAGAAGGKGQALIGAMVVLGVIEGIAMAVSAVVGFIALILVLVGFARGKPIAQADAQTTLGRDESNDENEKH